MPPHIRHDVADISSVDQLLRYAAAGQLQPLIGRQEISQERIALVAGLGATARSAGPVLATALRNGFTPRQLSGLDEAVGTLAPELDRAGRLSGLALRLWTEQRAENQESQLAKIRDAALAARVPASWARRMPYGPPATEIEVLMRATGLVSEFIAAGKLEQPGAVGTVRDRHRQEVAQVATHLALISTGPPTWRNYDAQTLLGLLSGFAFEDLKDFLERKVRYSPPGFRIWRAITMLMKFSVNSGHPGVLRDWIRELLRMSGELRKISLHAGSGYDLELALTVPLAWSPPDDDWVGDALWARARDREATLRERGTAAMGLWQRAIASDPGYRKDVQRELRELITEFRDPDARPDAAAGVRWIAATLEQVIDGEEAVCNKWPDPGELWYRHVHEAAAELGRLGVPEPLLQGTKNLFLHMILQNAGLYRRHAIETVVTSGMNRPVARALVSLLRAEPHEAWLRVRVQAALGFMQRNDVSAQSDLTLACSRAYEKMNDDAGDGPPLRSGITELHASLFAVGDCFGAASGDETGREARDLLAPVLTSLIDDGDRAALLRRPARAAAYLLGVTAQPRVNGRKDLSEELLEKLREHPDPVTRRLSSWVLSFRFADDGTVRPPLAAAEYGEPDDTPYWRKAPGARLPFAAGALRLPVPVVGRLVPHPRRQAVHAVGPPRATRDPVPGNKRHALLPLFAMNAKDDQREEPRSHAGGEYHGRDDCDCPDHLLTSSRCRVAGTGSRFALDECEPGAANRARPASQESHQLRLPSSRVPDDQVPARLQLRIEKLVRGDRAIRDVGLGQVRALLKPSQDDRGRRDKRDGDAFAVLRPGDVPGRRDSGPHLLLCLIYRACCWHIDRQPVAADLAANCCLPSLLMHQRTIMQLLWQQ
jgi:hypothetical protein